MSIDFAGRRIVVGGGIIIIGYVHKFSFYDIFLFNLYSYFTYIPILRV